MRSMNMKLLKIQITNLTKKYSKKIVFNNYDLLIDNSKINFLVSPNGFGKTTLIKTMLRLTCFKGSITSNCLKYAYCPEKVILPEYLKVIEFLNLFDIENERINYYLSKFKIPHNIRIKELSKGMHQKLIIIQAIAAEADGYFFDEPLNGLDFQSEQIFIDELFNLSKKHKLIVIASHYLEKYSSLPCNVINIVQND